MSALQRLLERVGHLDHQGRWVIGLVEGADFTEEARAALAEAGGNGDGLGGNVCMLRRRGAGSCQSWCRDSDTCPPGVKGSDHG